MKSAPPELPVLPFADALAFSKWLGKHHASSSGLWLKLAKSGSGVASVSYPEAVELALAWGWIDGQKRPLDARWWLQKFTRRGPKSLWSKKNREKALALIASGKMQPPGLLEVERAKRDGRWDAAYDPPSTSKVPEDLAAALALSPQAKKAFATLDSANRYAILWRVQTAKKPETRARRITELVALLARGDLLHPARARRTAGRRER